MQRSEKDRILRTLKSTPPIQFVLNALAALFSLLTEQFNIGFIYGLATLWSAVSVVFVFSGSVGLGWIHLFPSAGFAALGLAFFLRRTPEIFDCTIDACKGSKEIIFNFWFVLNYIATIVNLVIVFQVWKYVRAASRPTLPRRTKAE